MTFALRLILAICMTLQVGGAAAGEFERREFNPVIDGEWIGNGISYGAYRDGEAPGDITSKANVLEDLQILSKRWKLIRLYGSGQQSRNILEVIREHDLPVRVMQGAWISSHQTEAENREQIDGAIALANDFPKLVLAVNVGNEIFVDWSWHRIDDMDLVIDYIREVRSKIAQPVTVNDDYNFWNKEHAGRIAAEVDFIGLHAYAFWNNKTLDVAMDWTVSIYEDIQSRFPGYLIAYCETGWPTNRVYGDGSYEGGLIGKAGEAEQRIFFDQYDKPGSSRTELFRCTSKLSTNSGRVDSTVTIPMDKAEKHWGLYGSDRTPKAALRFNRRWPR